MVATDLAIPLKTDEWFLVAYHEVGMVLTKNLDTAKQAAENFHTVYRVKVAQTDLASAAFSAALPLLLLTEGNRIEGIAHPEGIELELFRYDYEGENMFDDYSPTMPEGTMLNPEGGFVLPSNWKWI